MIGFGLSLAQPRGRGIGEWTLEGSALDLDFQRGRYVSAGAVRAFADLFTFTRSSSGTAQRLDGSWQTFAAGVPRITDRGILIEEARTNGIRNNTVAGAAAGTPGTAPTNWSISGNPPGITREIVGFGVESGISYLDIRFFGTATGTNFPAIFFEANNSIAAVNGQTWTGSVFARLTSGASPQWNVQIGELNSGGATLISGAGSNVALSSAWQRISHTRTLNEATTAFVRTWLACTINNGETWDFTIRVGWPQLEQGAFATSPIPTSGSAATRAADALSLSLADSALLSDAAGSFFAEVDVPNPTHAFGRIYDVGTRFLYIDHGNNFAVFTRDAVNRTSSAPVLRNVPFKIAGGWGSSQHSVITTGTSLLKSNSGNTIQNNVAYIGNRSALDRGLCGYLRRLAVHQDELSDANLQALVA